MRCGPFPLDGLTGVGMTSRHNDLAPSPLTGEGWDGGEIPALVKLLAGVTPIPRYAGTSPMKGEGFFAHPHQGGWNLSARTPRFGFRVSR